MSFLTCKQNVRELWSIVKHMTDIPVLPSDSLVKARTSPNTQALFVRQALKYLQERLCLFFMKIFSLFFVVIQELL